MDEREVKVDSEQDVEELSSSEMNVKKYASVTGEIEHKLLGSTSRELNESEKELLERDKKPVSDFYKNKYEREANKYWDKFYKRNSTHFFKDRHWTEREFPELIPDPDKDLTLLEVGCGVGNAIFPLLKDNPRLFAHACDFSPTAIKFVKENKYYDTSRCNAFVCDITENPLINNVPEQSVDVVTALFVLSAISPEKMPSAVANIIKILKPGGVLLFRDYGLYDHAMLRLSANRTSKIDENFYVRIDGTRAYYFTTDFTEQLFKNAGFEIVLNTYFQSATINRKENVNVVRIFLQGRYRKPINATISDEAIVEPAQN